MTSEDRDAFGAFGVPAHVIEKNKREQVRIGLNEYRGSEYIDIRTFYLADDGYRPTSRGVTLPPRLFGELLRGVLELGTQLGVIDPDLVAQVFPEPSLDLPPTETPRARP
jgi:hypothetical protein